MSEPKSTKSPKSTANLFRQRLQEISLRRLATPIVAGLMILTSAGSISAQEEGDKSAEGDRPALRQGGGERFQRGGRPGEERPAQDRPGLFNRRGEGDPTGMRPGMPGGPMMVPPLMIALDTDKDGTLSASEIENAAKSLLTLDKDGDGVLSTEEMRPRMPEGFPGGRGAAVGPNGNPGAGQPGAGRPGAGGPGGGMAGEEFLKRMFEQRDTNKDGKLEGDEIPPQMMPRLEMIDTNQDGAIDAEEMKSLQRMRDRMGGPGQGRLQQQNRRDGEAVRPRRPASEAPASENPAEEPAAAEPKDGQ